MIFIYILYNWESDSNHNILYKNVSCFWCVCIFFLCTNPVEYSFKKYMYGYFTKSLPQCYSCNHIFYLVLLFSKSYGICCSCRRGGSVVCEIVNQYLHLFFFLEFRMIEKQQIGNYDLCQRKRGLYQKHNVVWLSDGLCWNYFALKHSSTKSTVYRCEPLLNSCYSALDTFIILGYCQMNESAGMV